jgi:hypothetical protein
MATEEGSGGMEDVEESLEPQRQQEGGNIWDKLSDIKESYVGFHRVDEESEKWGDQQVAGNLSRRGFVAGAAQVAAGAYAFTEATDNDGWNVDWSDGQATPAGAPATGTGGQGQQAGGAAADGDNELGVVGDVSDELYLQEDGTVIAIDFGHKEWRSFSPEEFPENSAYAGLHSELEDERDPSELPPPNLGTAIEVSQDELFNYDTTAYNDMSDEAEWDLIFDSNPNYSGGN